VTPAVRVEPAARRSPDRADFALLRHLVDTRLVGLLGVFAQLAWLRPALRAFRFGDGLCSQFSAEFGTGKGFRSPPVDWPRALDPHARLALPRVAHRAVHTGDHPRIGAPTHPFPPPSHPSRISIRSRPRLLNRQPSHSRGDGAVGCRRRRVTATPTARRLRGLRPRSAGFPTGRPSRHEVGIRPRCCPQKVSRFPRRDRGPGCC
jgi:hypothetical protein